MNIFYPKFCLAPIDLKRVLCYEYVTEATLFSNLAILSCNLFQRQTCIFSEVEL